MGVVERVESGGFVLRKPSNEKRFFFLTHIESVEPLITLID